MLTLPCLNSTSCLDQWIRTCNSKKTLDDCKCCYCRVCCMWSTALICIPPSPSAHTLYTRQEVRALCGVQFRWANCRIQCFAPQAKLWFIIYVGFVSALHMLADFSLGWRSVNTEKRFGEHCVCCSHHYHNCITADSRSRIKKQPVLEGWVWNWVRLLIKKKNHFEGHPFLLVLLHLRFCWISRWGCWCDTLMRCGLHFWA